MSDEITKQEIDEVLETKEETSWTSMDVYYKGFHIKKSFPSNVSSDTLIRTIDSLIEKGFKPSWNDETTQKALGQKTAVSGQQTASGKTLDLSIDGKSGQGGTCPVHGTKLEWKSGVSKAGKPYAFWSCPTRNADGSFCNAASQRK